MKIRKIVFIFLAGVVTILCGVLYFLGSLPKSELTTEERDLALTRAFYIAAEKYKETYGQFPSGDNKDMTKILTGYNSLNREFLDKDSILINEDGESTTTKGKIIKFISDGKTFKVDVNAQEKKHAHRE